MTEVQIAPTNHSSFSDTPFTAPQLISQFGGVIMAPARVHKLTAVYLLAFFDTYLRLRASALLEREDDRWPEATVRRYNAGLPGETLKRR